MKRRVKMRKADREVQEASDEATWDALEGYRDTGEMVPSEKDGQLVFLTVEEAFRTRDDYAKRKRANGDWRLKNLLDQFAAAGQTVTPDVWDRLEADRRQALEDDLAWIARGRKARPGTVWLQQGAAGRQRSQTVPGLAAKERQKTAGRQRSQTVPGLAAKEKKIT